MQVRAAAAGLGRHSTTRCQLVVRTQSRTKALPSHRLVGRTEITGAHYTKTKDPPITVVSRKSSLQRHRERC
jgi:hypothetical protein